MKPVTFTNSFYIKLGRAGAWEEDSIKTGKLRLGWQRQSTEDINAGNWEDILDQLRREHEDKPRGLATSDLNGLRNIATSTPEDVWITFHRAKLWWTRLIGPVEDDDTSKYRKTLAPWSDCDINGRVLFINELPGKITQLQGFRGTTCKVQYKDLLERTLNGKRSELSLEINLQLGSSAKLLGEAIKELHWKDFETLVDLIFRAAGWIRISVLGQHAKALDLELREPIIGDRYVVQVKSRAGIAELQETIRSFSPDDYRRVFFVVHSPDSSLQTAADVPTHIEIVGPVRLGQLAMDAGLAAWISDKVS